MYTTTHRPHPHGVCHGHKQAGRKVHDVTQLKEEGHEQKGMPSSEAWMEEEASHMRAASLDAD